MPRSPLLLAFVVTCTSVASFLAELETSSARWELHAVNRGSQVLIFCALAWGLAVGRRDSTWSFRAQMAAAAATIGFVIVAVVKLYATASAFDDGLFRAFPWAGQATGLAFATLTFALLGTRGSRQAASLALAAAVGATVGSAAYAIALRGAPRAELWWSLARTMAVLAAAAAARVERGSAGV